MNDHLWKVTTTFKFSPVLEGDDNSSVVDFIIAPSAEAAIKIALTMGVETDLAGTLEWPESEILISNVELVSWYVFGHKQRDADFRQDK